MYDHFHSFYMNYVLDILDNFIETLNENNKTAVNIWDEICIDTPTQIHYHGNISS